MRRLLAIAIPLAGVLLAFAASSGSPSEHEPAADVGDQAPTAEPPVVKRLKVPLEDGMLVLPGGTFSMGSDGLHAQPNEKPVHSVKLAPFRIDRTEVTVGQARACIAKGACAAPPPPTNRACTFASGDDEQPLNCVTWKYADAFCRALGKRLPTEAEWEYAAHASEHVRYPWGSGSPTCELAVTLLSHRTATSCSPSGPARVGTHPKGASPFGVQDLAGNVEEWVADWYADRYEVPTASPTIEPKGPGWGVAHVLRGGGWMSSPRDARASARNWGSPNEAGPNVGFRCAKE